MSVNLIRTLFILITFLLPLVKCFCQKDTIKIGLLIQNNNSTAAQRGADMAVRKANLKNSNKYFVLAVRSMEGPWGTGSRMAVDLVFREKVWAIIGSVDGRNSHLAEQVSAKTRIPFLSAWSGDPTLAYAFIPWYYCCVPNDQQKASAIADHIMKGSSAGTAVVTARDYDSNMLSEYFARTAKEKGFPGTSFYRYDKISTLDSISRAIKTKGARNIVFFGPVSSLAELKKDLVPLNFRIFCFSYADGEKEIDKNVLEGITFVSPGYYFTPEGKKFRDEFLAAYGRLPGDASAYAFDMTNTVISSLMVYAGDRDSLKNYLKKTDFEGITGRISFDERGNRKWKAELMTVRKGEFVREQ